MPVRTHLVVGTKTRLCNVTIRDEHGNKVGTKPALFHTWEQRVVPMLDMDTGETRYHAYVMAITETARGKIEKHNPSDIVFMDTADEIDRMREKLARRMERNGTNEVER